MLNSKRITGVRNGAGGRFTVANSSPGLNGFVCTLQYFNLFGIVNCHHHAFIVWRIPIFKVITFIIVPFPKGQAATHAVEILIRPLYILEIPVCHAPPSKRSCLVSVCMSLPQGPQLVISTVPATAPQTSSVVRFNLSIPRSYSAAMILCMQLRWSALPEICFCCNIFRGMNGDRTTNACSS